MSILIEEFINTILESKFQPKVILEIGAERGQDASKLRNAFPTAKIWAFEADPDTYKKYHKLHEESEINYIQQAVSNVDLDSVTFYSKDGKPQPGMADGPGAISSLLDRRGGYAGKKVTVTTKRIDTICEENNIQQIDVVKLDVEGCSYEVLEGFGEHLSNVRFLHVETEQTQLFTGQATEEKVFNLLESHGLKILKHSHCCSSQFDSVWTKNIT